MRGATTLVVLSLVLAAAGCSGMEWLRTNRVTGETLEGTYEADRSEGGRKIVQREWELPPLPVYAPPAPPLLPARPQPKSAVSAAAGVARPPTPQAPPVSSQVPIGYVPGGRLVEYLEYVNPNTLSEKSTGKSKGASSSGPPGGSLASGKAPQFDLKKGKMAGGGTSFISEISQAFEGPMVWVWIGGVLLAGGLILRLAFKQTYGWGIAVAGLVVGALGFMAGFYSWLVIVAFVFVVLGLGLWLWKTGALTSLFTKAKAAVMQVVAGGEAFKDRLVEALPRIMADEKLTTAQKARAVVAVFHAAQDSTQVDKATGEMVDKAQDEVKKNGNV